jgi:hypothetical protein
LNEHPRSEGPTFCLAVVGLVALNAIAAPTDLPLIQKVNLEYQGAFRVPQGANDIVSFSYGGTALGYNPGNDSLYITGHDHAQLSAEIGIPAIVNSTNLDDLAVAAVLQTFADATEGKLAQINPSDPNPKKIGGHLVYNGKLIVTGYSYYDGAGTQGSSHFSRPLSLSTAGQVVGPYSVGEDPHFVDGYMTLVPPEWEALFAGPALTGMCCLAIAGVQSNGPSISVFNPSSTGRSAIRLLGYPASAPLKPVSSTNPVYNLTSSISGAVFPGGTRSVLFFGRHGTGAYCYGEGAECSDPADDSKGVHGYPYVYQVWAYDANDLLAVKNRSKPESRPQPYAIWTFELPFEHPKSTHFLGGAAYDPKTQRIYLSQLRGDAPRPLIHVFKVAGTAPSPAIAPASPPPRATPAQDPLDFVD